MIKNTASQYLRILVLVGLLLSRAYAVERLPSVHADIHQTSLSGVSSGGYMAVQFHMAHSRIIKGVGVFAAGPYLCAQGSFADTLNRCMQPKDPRFLPSLKKLVEQTARLEKAGKIDPLSGLQNAKVFLFSGTNDQVVFPSVVNQLREYYSYYVNPKNIIYKNDLKAGHAMITNHYGKPCSYNGAPFLNNCQYDGAEKILRHIYGNLNPPSKQPTGKLIAFDQGEFIDPQTTAQYGLAKEGYVYIPSACQTYRCRIHVFFHGCQQNADTLKTELIENAGFHRWADTNHLIILYPQSAAFITLSPDPGKSNPFGCWDWWGYSSTDYYSQKAPQITAVMKMIERLSRLPHHH
jgi:poly(3-hydroxybutyrate) depolymerase